MQGHNPLWRNECELKLQLLDLDPLPEQISTSEPLLDFSQFPESVLVPILPESKTIIPSFHTPFWDKGVVNNDFEIILKL